MTEEKKPLIIKGPKTKKQKEEKKFYTIISCCVGAIFLITLIFPLISNSNQKPSEIAYSSFSEPDLANQYIDDESERILLEMNNYSDIPEQKVAEGLYSKEEKEARQKEDEEKGIPAAPDEEYKKSYSKARARVKAAKLANSARSASSTTTAKGNMKDSKMATAPGGGSGVTSSIWTTPDKKNQQAGNKTGNRTTDIKTQQLTASLDKKGRSNSFIRAAEKSSEAGQALNKGNNDSASQLATEAFVNDSLKAEDDDLTDGMDAFAENFDSEKLEKALNNDALTDLQNEMDKEKDKSDKTEVDPCKSKDNATRRACKRDELLGDLFKKMADTALEIVKTLATKDKKEELTDEQKIELGNNLDNMKKAKYKQSLPDGANVTWDKQEAKVLYKQYCGSLRGYHRWANNQNTVPCH